MKYDYYLEKKKTLKLKGSNSINVELGFIEEKYFSSV